MQSECKRCNVHCTCNRLNYIYVIKNIHTVQLYVGRTNNPDQRRRSHFSQLRKGNHSNPKLQNSFNKYGEDNFIFEIVDTALEKDIYDKEYEWFKFFDFDADTLFNCHFQTHGGPKIWKPHSEESKQKLSKSLKDRTRTYIFEILDERYETRASIINLCKKHNVSSNTLKDYTPEWEELRGLKMFDSPQTLGSRERVAKFAEDFKVIGIEATKNLKDYNVSHQALKKYLPEFGLTLEDTHIRADAVEKALAAIQMVKETGCSASHAIRSCKTSVTSFYKYLKLQTQQGATC